MLQVMGTSSDRPSALRIRRTPLKWALVAGRSERNSAAKAAPATFCSGEAAGTYPEKLQSAKATMAEHLFNAAEQFILTATLTGLTRKYAEQNGLSTFSGSLWGPRSNHFGSSPGESPV